MLARLCHFYKKEGEEKKRIEKIMNEKNKLYDLIIIGAGPAGLGASIYASRYKLKNVVIGSEIGGQVVEATEIENYAGFDSISGRDLMQKFQKQTENLGAKIVQAEAGDIKKTEDEFEVSVENGEKYRAKNIILALGMNPRKMNIPGEKEFIGKGVSYCATCDAMFFTNKDVAVIGGGDSAATAAIHLSDFANKIYLIHRGNIRFKPALAEQIKQSSKIEIIDSTGIKEIKGNQAVESVIYESKSGEKEILAQGIFVEIGSVPKVAIAKNLGVEMDEQEYIIVDQAQKTNVENVYAAGDVTTGSNKFRQIITAVAEGAIAAGSVYKKIKT